jgi:hypothetical protein
VFLFACVKMETHQRLKLWTRAGAGDRQDIRQLLAVFLLKRDSTVAGHGLIAASPDRCVGPVFIATSSFDNLLNANTN